MGEFKWSETREQAALLLAVGEISDGEIARRLKVSASSLGRWKKEPTFSGRIDECVREIRGTTFTQEIASMAKRVERLNERWQQIAQVVRERGSDPSMQRVPGGKTGLMVHDVRRPSEKGEPIDVYRLDTGLIREERELAKQAAQECGHWTDRVKADVTTREGAPEQEPKYDFSGLTMAEKEQFLALAEKAETATTKKNL